MTTQKVLLVIGAYYFITALWPLVHIKSFEKVTGPKNDHWLVYTVAAMIMCSSFVFLSASLNEFQPSKEILILAYSNALALSLVDVIFVAKKIISKVYLLDAVAEMALLVMLTLSL